MKNLTHFLNKNILLTILMFFAFYVISFAQEDVNYSQVKQVEGLVMQRLDNSEEATTETTGKGLINFHHRPEAGPNNTDFDFIYSRSTSGTTLTDPSSTFPGVGNNMVMTNTGLIVVADADGCLHLTPPDFGETVRLYVNGDIANSTGNPLNSIPSDINLKKNIADLKNSLETLREINFVEYEYNGLASTVVGRKHYGVIAQEINQVMPSTISTIKRQLNSWDKENTELLMFNPSNLMFTGLNATKELADLSEEKFEALFEELELEREKNQILEKRIEALESKLMVLIDATVEDLPSSPIHTSTERGLENQGRLYPNIPNPLSEKTLIKYELPTNVSEAFILIQNLSGKTLDRIELVPNVQNNVIEFDGKNILRVSGTYIYSLVVNGKLIDSKKMVLIER